MDIMIVGIVAVFSAGYLVRRMVRAVKAKNPGCGCGGCSACSTKLTTFFEKEKSGSRKDMPSA
jgi:hypothetical protein